MLLLFTVINFLSNLIIGSHLTEHDDDITDLRNVGVLLNCYKFILCFCIDEIQSYMIQ